MKRIITLLLTVAIIVCCFAGCGKTENDATTDATTEATTDVTTEATTEATTVVEPITVAEAFTGEIEAILNSIVTRAIEIDMAAWTEEYEYYGIGTIECEPTPVDEDSCTSILGLDTDEFYALVDSAIESKPLGSWYTHSVVVIKLKDGVDVAETAQKIVMNTKPNRFGCLKPSSIVGAYTGDYVIFTASDESACNSVYSAVVELSALEAVRIDRENTWKNSGGLLIP